MMASRIHQIANNYAKIKTKNGKISRLYKNRFWDSLSPFYEKPLLSTPRIEWTENGWEEQEEV